MTSTTIRTRVSAIAAIAGLVGCAFANELTPQTKEFYRIVQTKTPPDQGSYELAVQYLRGLPPTEQLSVGRNLVNDTDWKVGCIGVAVLTDAGKLEEVVSPLASMIAKGQQDCMGLLVKSGVHSDDGTVTLQVLVRVSRHLLANLENYKGDERKRVEEFLSAGLFSKSTKPFSYEDASRRIADWEEQIRKLQSSAPKTPK